MPPRPRSQDVRPQELDWLAQALKLSPAFNERPDLESLLASLPGIILETWPEGGEVLREGAPGEDFFVVYEGELSAQRGDQELGRLRSGDFFGEIGFLMTGARSASVRTLSPARAFRFRAEAFAALLRRHEALEGWVKSVASRRLHKLFLGT